MMGPRRLIAALVARLERRFGFPDLHARQAQLLASGAALLEQADRLEAAIAAGFSAAQADRARDAAALGRLAAQVGQGFEAVAARGAAVESRLEALGAELQRLDRGLGALDARLDGIGAIQGALRGALEAGFAESAEVTREVAARLVPLAEALHRIVRDVRAGFAALAGRAEADLAAIAAQGHDLEAQLVEVRQRLEGASQAGFAALGDRLDAAASGLAGQGADLGARLADLARAAERRESEAAALVAGGARVERDIAILAEQIGQLGGHVNQLAGFLQTLDRNVGENFAGIGRRLESDLVTLAGRTHDLVEGSRHVAGTLARLAADQIERAPAAAPVIAAARRDSPGVAAPAPLVRLAEAGLPAAVRTAIAARGFDLPPTRCLDRAALPRGPDDLPRWPALMAACRAALTAGAPLVLAEPAAAATLSDAEVVQTLGLVGPVAPPFAVADGAGSWRIALATRRVEGMAVVLRWSLAALETAHIHLGPLADEMLRRTVGGLAAHAIDLPEPGADVAGWARLLPSLLATIGRQGAPCVGICLPTHFAAASEQMDAALAHLRAALRDSGAGEAIAFQWVRGAPALAASAAILDFAQARGIGFDLTAVSRRLPGPGLPAYDDRAPFRPLGFDLRLPCFAGGDAAPVEIPRWPARALALDAGGGAPRLREAFAEEFARDAARLARVLDRAGQRQYERQVNLDATLIDYWPDYFVHNWAPPAPAWLRLIACDAADLFAAASPLVRLFGADRGADRALMDGPGFLAAAARAAARPVHRDVRRLQIDAHGYQPERRAITADAERLIGWMPDRLGDALELGSGLGLLAARLRDRARFYVGVDLTAEQASAVRAAGAEALAADIERLPFADACFDTVLADNVVEHAADPLQTLRECHRVLRPGGQAFFIIPPDYEGAGFANAAHLWKADAASVRHALACAGFRLVRQESLRLAELGVPGAYPSSGGRTELWQAEKPAAPEGARAGGAAAAPFDLAAAAAYWRFAPSGAGKHDTAALVAGSPADLFAAWDAGFLARFRSYPEEALFLETMAAEFAGRRLLSIGSGLGFHEIAYALRGAEVACCDIVGSNLAAIARVAAAKGAEGMRFIASAGPDQDLGGPYDVVFVYGSLMTMPEPMQRRLAARCLEALAPGGRIVLMTYAWAFARATCGWETPDRFDPRRFARASDPSVGDAHCPWSDWHDEARLEDLFAGLQVARRQSWNQGWYFWCELRREATGQAGGFFAPERLAEGARRREIDLGALQPAEATAAAAGRGLAVTTADTACGYALVGPAQLRGKGANALLVEADLEEGGFSLGILDVAEDRFAFAQAVWQPGRARHLFAFENLPARFRLIVSNHRPAAPGVSRFVLHRLTLLDRPVFAPPPDLR